MTKDEKVSKIEFELYKGAKIYASDFFYFGAGNEVRTRGLDLGKVLVVHRKRQLKHKLRELECKILVRG